MRRREYLAGATTASVGLLSGCAGLTEPQMEFRRFVVPDPNVVNIDVDGDEYFSTIHNRGKSGNIRSELWYFRDSNSTLSAPSIYQADISGGRHFDSAISSYFSADERRKVSIIGSDNAPSQSEFPDFNIISWPASHGAVFENSGDTGEVEFKFKYRTTGIYNAVEPANKLDTVSSNSTIEIIFDTVVPPGAEYEIVAEPV